MSTISVLVAVLVILATGLEVWFWSAGIAWHADDPGRDPRNGL